MTNPIETAKLQQVIGKIEAIEQAAIPNMS
jgi:hypothetical protein